MNMTLSAIPSSQLDTIVVRPRNYLIVLALLASIGFVILGGWFTVAERNDLRALVIGPLSVAFFGWAGVVGAQRLFSGWAMDISPLGMTIAGPTGEAKQLRWVDIEGFIIIKVAHQKLLGIKLSRVDNLASQYSEHEAKVLLRRHNILTGLLAVLQPAAIAKSVGNNEVEGFFRGQRSTYGADVILGWQDRDRGADAFMEYLESFRRRFSIQPQDTNHA